MAEKRVSFLVESHLGRLAKWLRFLGYDVASYKGATFTNLARLAAKERRVLLTRSEKQARSEWKFARRLIASDDYRMQLRELADLIEIDPDIAGSRCIHCNRPLYTIAREKVRSLVPEYVYETQADFVICRKCGHVFWRGTHYDKMIEMLYSLLQGDVAETSR